MVAASEAGTSVSTTLRFSACLQEKKTAMTIARNKYFGMWYFFLKLN
jgi:hypothetical protein